MAEAGLAMATEDAEALLEYLVETDHDFQVSLLVQKLFQEGVLHCWQGKAACCANADASIPESLGLRCGPGYAFRASRACDQ